jgi:hypothetical protein
MLPPHGGEQHGFADGGEATLHRLTLQFFTRGGL